MAISLYLSYTGPDELRRVARAPVETPNAPDYLKALCPHIDRGATEAYESERGTVQFSFGRTLLLPRKGGRRPLGALRG
jgi:hypothetical protein